MANGTNNGAELIEIRRVMSWKSSIKVTFADLFFYFFLAFLCVLSCGCQSVSIAICYEAKSVITYCVLSGSVIM